MNSMYLIIIAAAVFLIFCIIAYHLYQEARFRKMVENTFNQNTDDILMHSNKKIVFEGENRSIAVKLGGDLIQKDKAAAELFETKNPVVHLDKETENAVINLKKDEPKSLDLDFMNSEEAVPSDPSPLNIFADIVSEVEAIPEDSVEAFFAKQDKINFVFASEVHPDLDLVIDIVFEENIKIKTLLDITQFTQKSFKIYGLDKNNSWYKFAAGKKHVISGLKLVLELVDHDGIINQAQIANIYNVLHKFVIENHGHIRVSDYAANLEKIKIATSHIEDIELDLNLYLITRDALKYKDISMFLAKNNFVDKGGVFASILNGVELFTLTDEHGQALKMGNEYKLFTLCAKLHLQQNPLSLVDAIFDFAEKFMQMFESRILTTNKLILGEKEYKALIDYVAEYVASSKKYGIELGGELLRRVY